MRCRKTRKSRFDLVVPQALVALFGHAATAPQAMTIITLMTFTWRQA